MKIKKLEWENSGRYIDGSHIIAKTSIGTFAIDPDSEQLTVWFRSVDVYISYNTDENGIKQAKLFCQEMFENIISQCLTIEKQ